MAHEKRKPDLIAYTVQKTGSKSHFKDIGAAWADTKDGYLVVLQALPVNGNFILRPPRNGERGEEPGA